MVLFVAGAWAPGARNPPCCAARGARGRLLHRQRRERRRRARDHRQDRRAAARRRGRRDHARQLDLGPARLRAVPLGDRPRAAPGEPLAGLSGPRARDPRRRRGDQPARPDDAEPVREPVRHRRAARRGGTARDAGDRRRLPRRGDEREGRARLPPRRSRDRRARHPHARPDERRPGPRGRDRRDHRRRDDRPARLGDRQRARGRDPPFRHRVPVRLEPASGDVRIEGALVECGADGRALPRCEAVRVPAP